METSPDLEDVTGEYFDRTQRARVDAQAYDTQARRRLWELTERWVAWPADAGAGRNTPGRSGRPRRGTRGRTPGLELTGPVR